MSDQNVNDVFAQAIVHPDGTRMIRLTFSDGVTHDVTALRQNVAPQRVSATHYLGGGVHLTIAYEGQSGVTTMDIPLSDLPPHAHR